MHMPGYSLHDWPMSYSQSFQLMAPIIMLKSAIECLNQKASNCHLFVINEYTCAGHLLLTCQLQIVTNLTT